MSHSFLSPSSFPRIAKCPASLLASLHAPPRVSAGTAADEGSRLHGVAEAILKQATILWPPTIHENDSMVQTYVEYCQALIVRADRYGIESRVSLDGFAPINGQSGTLDFWALVEKELHVVDFKSGSVRVAPDSEQLLAYAGGLMTSEFPSYTGITKVVLTIVQQNHIEHHTMTLEEFWRELKGLSNVLLSALKPNPEFRPSDEACQYCPAAGACSARAAMFEGLLKATETNEVSLMPLDKVEETFIWKSRVDRYFKQIEEFLLNTLHSGTELKFFELGKSKPHRTWSTLNGLDFINKAKERGIEDPFILLDPISPAKAEKALGKKVFTATIGSLVFQPEGEAKIVAKVFDK